MTDDILLDSPDADELAGDSEWWRIYAESMPPNEREPVEVILSSVRRAVGAAFRARSGDATVGIATTHLLLDPAAVFLVYLAVDNRFRRNGSGGKLFEHAWMASAGLLRGRGYSPFGLIWEVDDTRLAGDPGEQLVRNRRIQFFTRHGGVVLAQRYFQPPVNGTESVPMRLMYRPGEGAAMPGPSSVEALVRAIYFEKYGAVNQIDAATLRALLNKSLSTPI